MSRSSLPGCPLCHRSDGVVPLEEAPKELASENSRSYPCWKKPNLACLQCSLPMEFDLGTGKFAPFGVLNARNVVHAYNYDEYLGWGDANWAWEEALKRIASARRHDPGPDSFEFYGYLKRAGTWTMKAWLASHSHSPDRSWRYDETSNELGLRAGWDAMRAFQDFGIRVTRLLHGRHPEIVRKEALSHSERSDFANIYIEEILELHRWMREGGPLPPRYAAAVRGAPEEKKLLQRTPHWTPSRQIDSNVLALQKLISGFYEETVKLDFPVNGRVLAVAHARDWDNRSPYVVLRVPWNGMWWEKESSPPPEQPIEDGCTDIVLSWGTQAPSPQAGDWIQVIPHGDGIEGIAPESTVARKQWLLALPKLDKEAKREISYSFKHPPPLSPSLSREYRPECDDDYHPDPPGIWFQFLDSPELKRFFEYDHCVRISPHLPEDTGQKLETLYYCYHDPADIEFVCAFVRLDRSTGKVIWEKVQLDGAGAVDRRLGPALALPLGCFGGEMG